MGGEEASTSEPLPTAVQDAPVSTATTAAVVPSPTAVTGDPAEPVATATKAAGSGGWDDLVIFNNLPRDHDPNLQDDYGSLPPAGGTHNPQWLTCGFYDEPVWTEQAIHSLEHGAVWIAYRPDLPADQINYLQKLPEGHTHILVTPWPGLASDVVLTAWGLQLQIPSLPDERVEEFIDRYEQGPQNPEPGVPC
jgi:hypothetical protein